MNCRIALAVASLVLLSAGGASVLRAQISPGPLARAHGQLEGALNCARCHGPKKSDMNASCLSCHQEITWLVERRRGFHAGPAARSKATCAACHPDHAGREFALIEWPAGTPERFDHRTTGWSLDGAHGELKCQECHATEYRSSESARLSKRTTGPGWIGLETTCASCHAADDAHRGALKVACNACHDSRDWKNAPKFSHDSTEYPLTGKHASVACNDCHVSKHLPVRQDGQGRPIPVYSPVPFRGCGDCHDDPHRGRLSTRCAECHSTQGFATIEGRAFNHSLTRYPLKGRHGRVACSSCHGVDLTKPKPAFDRCGSCHSDPHNGSAVLAGKPVDCEACHRVDGFSPSTFTVAQHASSPYPLQGRHAQVSCVKCHAPSPATDRTPGARPVALIRMAFGRCVDCHADAHAGQLASRADQGTCDGCHAVNGWRPSTYSVARHSALRTRLDGRHGEIPCRACHAGDRVGLPAPARTQSLGPAGVAVTLPGSKCADCHVDPHQGRYASGGALPVDGDCGACHSPRSFKPSLVDATVHDRFSFRLEGAHRAVGCVACHAELGRAPAMSTLVLSSRGITRFPSSAVARPCAACHDNPHGDQFADRKSQCESCHGTVRFVPASRFDHDRNTSFALRGAHAQVLCARCHVTKDVAGTRTTIYRPLSGKCESCHGRETS